MQVDHIRNRHVAMVRMAVLAPLWVTFPTFPDTALKHSSVIAFHFLWAEVWSPSWQGHREPSSFVTLPYGGGDGFLSMMQCFADRPSL